VVSGVWISCVAVSAKALSEIDVGRLVGAWEAMLKSQMVWGFHRFWHLTLVALGGVLVLRLQGAK
jgi:hypothetical protein